MKTLAQTVGHVRLGEPVQSGGLTMFPLLNGGSNHVEYYTLDEALKQELATVTELSEAGSVPELKFVSTADKPILLLDGEELIGAKQNRVLNLSLLVAAGATVVIPVSCVEAGRWRHNSDHFRTSDHAYHASARSKKMRRVSESLCCHSRATADQHEVWADVSLKLESFQVGSPTAALNEVFAHRSADLDEHVEALTPSPGQVGAVFAIGDRVAGLELFDSTETLQKLLPKLVRSYGLDTLAHPTETGTLTPEAAQAFLAAVADADGQEYPSTGLGTDLRFDTPTLTGGALVVDGRVIHLSAFPGSTAEHCDTSRPISRLASASRRRRGRRDTPSENEVESE